MDGVRVLVDPVWDERASPFSFFGPKRFFRPTMRLEEMPRLDAVLLSHDHYDHLGEKTVRGLAKLQPETRWVAPLGVGAILERFDVQTRRISEVGLDAAGGYGGDGWSGDDGDGGAGAAFFRARRDESERDVMDGVRVADGAAPGILRGGHRDVAGVCGDRKGVWRV